jgi:trimeric autotransporter adhesin
MKKVNPVHTVICFKKAKSLLSSFRFFLQCIATGILCFSSAHPINGQNPYLIRDINNIPGNNLSSNPQTVNLVNGIGYFQANDGLSGTEIWRTDGTFTGTYLVKDIRAGLPGSGANNFTSFGAIVIFSADDGINGNEIWRSDGTAAGTYMIKDIQIPSGSNPGNFVEFNGAIYFTASTVANGNELWKTDGTSGGTILFKDIWPGASGSNPVSFRLYNGELYFVASDGSNGTEIWKTDGTQGGTIMVKDINTSSGIGSNPANLIVSSGHLYFSANDGVTGIELWKTDGTNTGTFLAADIRTGASSSSPSDFASINDQLYFKANDGVSGIELWNYNTSANVAQLVKDINPGAGNSNPSNLNNLNGSLLFSAFDGIQGPELWKSDGTSGGTNLLKDIRAGSSSSSNLSNFTLVSNLLFIRADNGVNGFELWKSDGSEAGTSLVKDIWPGLTSSSPLALKNINGVLYFSANDGTFGVELWKSDGTSAGTQMIKDINQGSGNAAPANLTNGNGLLYFSASDGVNGTELWKSNGSHLGTQMVKNIRPGSGSSQLSGNQGQFAYFDNTLFFRADDGTNGLELWKSDGTESGTVLIKDINPGSGSSNAFGTVKYNGSYFFIANNGTQGFELWKTDGTPGGTIIVKDINPGAGSAVSSTIQILNGNLYFFANNGAQGLELWKSDGTESGTVLVKDINPGASDSWSSSFNFFTSFNNNLFFFADNGTQGFELWKSDGTSGGTQLVKDIYPGINSSNPNAAYFVVSGGELYFRANDGSTGEELWKTDGSNAGTLLVKDIRTGNASSLPQDFIQYNGMVFFNADDGISGRELWKTDGTQSGTVLVKEVNPGANGGAGQMVLSNGNLYFAGNDGANGSELWKTDGTNAGTVLVKDILKGTTSSFPQNLVDVNGKLFFSANFIDEDNFQFSSELWSLGNCTVNNEIDSAAGKYYHFNSEVQSNPNTAICFCDVYNNLIATVNAIGSNPATEPMEVRKWIEPINPSDFAKPHYEITPDNNPGTATAKITLYFKQTDFDAYNSKNPAPVTYLPASSSDADGIANIRIDKKNGKSSNKSGLPLSYPGSVTTLNPDDADVVWNQTMNRWEISTPITGFSGFWLNSYPCPELLIAPANVTLVNSTCNGCSVSGGIITAPGGTPCPYGSTIQYQVNGGSWNTSLPDYDQTGPAQTIKTRCACNQLSSVVSPASASVKTIPGTCPACPFPKQLAHIQITSTSAKIIWKAANGPCVTNYELRYRYEIQTGIWSGWTNWVGKNGSGLDHLFSGLSPATFYHYQVRSVCGSQSNSVSINNWFNTLPTGSLKQLNDGLADQAIGDLVSLHMNSFSEKNVPAIDLIPNPATEYVRIQISGFDNSSKLLYLMDNQGRLVFQVKLKADENLIELDLMSLQITSGTYWLRLSNAQQQKSAQLIVETLK